jgi:deoxyadenosine/deoxycytidine kinase
MEIRYPYLAIEGNIGSGKTTLSKLLAKDNANILMLEQFEDNSFLPKFYADQRRYAFPLELSFMAARFNQLKDSIKTNAEIFSPKQVIADYSFFKNLVFAQVTLEDDEYKLFYKLYEILMPQLVRPDLIVYLHQPVNRLIANISKRGRNYEKDIRPSYLEKIEHGYFEYFKQMPQQKVLVIDAKELDFVESESDLEWLKEKIFNCDYPKGITRPII